MVASYIIWYIVVGNAAGVIGKSLYLRHKIASGKTLTSCSVFLWIWMLIGFYALLKFPKFVVVGRSHLTTKSNTRPHS